MISHVVFYIQKGYDPMLPPYFDKEELSADFQDIASAVDESGSAVLFKNGMPVTR